MVLQIRQTLRQTQQLVMTPQLQQAIKLLQYGHLEMLDAVEHELRENPILEEVAADDFHASDGPKANDKLHELEQAIKEPPALDNNGSDAEWGAYLETYGGDYSPRARDAEDRFTAENLATNKESFFEYLLKQLQCSNIEGIQRRIAFELIGNVDENGYLDVELDDVARVCGVSSGDVERVLMLVQGFDPSGVAARNIRECLLIQAIALVPENPLVERILTEAFDSFQKGNLEQTSRILKTDLDEITDAARLIASLDPRPGRTFQNSDTVFVIPDIFIVKDGSDYAVLLNDDGIPRLRISNFYQQQLHSSDSSPVTRDYIQEKIRGAKWLIKSIQQRQQTIYKVTKSILRFQREFFDKGIDYLKPLILRDVAEDIEMHESTISRVTTNKYAHTPRGIYELKFFFNAGISHGTEAISSESVKNQISRIIKNEDPKKPVSDKQIVEHLEAGGINIARRTVAKYREAMGVAPSSRRKKKY
ncbi:MAG: RNA polymerase factor sigma-54 [Pseudomonadota bacterium]